MKKLKLIFITSIWLLASISSAQIGYYDAPYLRYEADLGTLTNATVTSKSYQQSDLQSEASGQVCVNLANIGSLVGWTLSQPADGLVLRYSVPEGQTGTLDVQADGVSVGTLNLNTYYSWEHLSVSTPGVKNTNPKMRFDEVRLKLSSALSSGTNLSLVNQSGNIFIDFVELESVPTIVSSAIGDVVYVGDGSDLQTFIDGNGGKTIYLGAGVYNVNRELYFGVSNTNLKGAGSWYTEIHFTNTSTNGGLRANASNINFSGLYLSTVRNSRSNSYKAINGVYTSGSTITDLWAEHFECGAWIGQYNTGGPAYADGFNLSNCRFRNNYADGINLCKGTSNATVAHCSFRNNGDDDMAIWSANGLECKNNTFSYNTSEHCWRSSGCAIYGGYNNKADHLLIKDNVEVGIRVNNSYSGVGFNENGMHEFSNITIISCGTFNDLWYTAVGAIDLVSDNVAGTRVSNVKFSNIDIIDSKNDAIYFFKRAGEGFYNLVFENITINGTGTEYPFNNANNLNWGRGYGILFVGNPAGYGTYCNMTYLNRGGNATVNINNAQIGSFSFTSECIPDYAPVITSKSIFGVCDGTVNFSATAAAPASNTVSYVEFFVDNTSIGQDNTDPYTMGWNNPTVGNHQVTAVAYYAPSNTSSSSYIQNIEVEDGIYSTSKAPIIDGVVDVLWNNYNAFSLNKVSVGTVSSPADLSATFKVTRDATNFYILADVNDDILNNSGSANWQKDGIEIYIDMGNDKSGSYVPNSDFQYSFVWDVSTSQSGLTFAQTTKPGNNGYIFEISIPWLTLKGAQASGTFIGFDLQVEDDDSGTRNGKIAWADGTDNAWQSTSVLGTLQIADCKNPLLAVDPASFNAEGNQIRFYPNPFITSGNLEIQSNGNLDLTTINIKDMSGKLLIQQSFHGNGPYTVGESLSSGLYLLEVFDGKSLQTIKLTKF
jgi:hypothetical protein